MGKPEISSGIPEPYRGAISKLAERLYEDATDHNTDTVNLTPEKLDDLLRDIDKVMEQANSGLKGIARTEASSALMTLREVARNLSASLSMRRASVGQYDTPFPGSRWRTAT